MCVCLCMCVSACLDISPFITLSKERREREREERERDTHTHTHTHTEQRYRKTFIQRQRQTIGFAAICSLRLNRIHCERFYVVSLELVFLRRKSGKLFHLYLYFKVPTDNECELLIYLCIYASIMRHQKPASDVMKSCVHSFMTT